mmetsp:Transcript_9541/g.14340  ORF Transcript_9541/g.14340 Transcript_9541/m.14340 type:complete len:184 (-) Transcript_9541:113-664(-)
MMYTILPLLLTILQTAAAFTFQNNNAARTSNLSALNMVPRFSKTTQKWEPTSEKDTEGGYDLMGSLIRQGPMPFIKRVQDPDLYDQMVLKYMAGDGVDRLEAQGNIDAFLANPNDWIVQKNAEKRGAAKYDYAKANTNTGQLIKTTIWAMIVFGYVGRIIYVFWTTKGELVADNLQVMDQVIQ